MPQPKRLRIYLEDDLRESAAAGQHNFLRLVQEVAEQAGFNVILRPNTEPERIKASARRGYGLMHMTPPANERCLTFRRAYYYPFWQIDPSDQRWDWQVAKAEFDPALIDADEANRFFGFWQNRLFEPVLGDLSDEGFIYVPLQGRLMEQRSFQTVSPIQMLHRTRAGFSDRKIIATLHPKEIYSEADISALEAFAADDGNTEIHMGQRDHFLPRCHAIVTQNSSVAFDGFFFRKPALTFAKIDFHHITLPGFDPNSFAQASAHAPNYAAYVFWFWQVQAINAGHASAKAKIAKKLAAAGWPVA